MPFPISKFVLVALPGTGKTTACHKCAETLRANKLADLQVISVDIEIKKRSLVTDPIIQKFMRDYSEIDWKIIFNKGPISLSSKMIETHGEEVWRELEADFCIDILKNKNLGIIDLGGKMFLNETVRRFVEDQSITSIYLYVNQETIESHLLENDNWKSRGNYLNAGEHGWQRLSIQHNHERSLLMFNSTQIAIDVSEQKPEDTAREILFRMYEFNELRQNDKKSYGIRVTDQP